MDRRAILSLLGALPLLQLVKSLPAEACEPIVIGKHSQAIRVVGFSQARGSLVSAVTVDLPPGLQVGDIIFVIAWPDATAVQGFTRCQSCGITIFHKMAGQEDLGKRSVAIETLSPDIIALSLTVRGTPPAPGQTIEDLRRSL